MVYGEHLQPPGVLTQGKFAPIPRLYFTDLPLCSQKGSVCSGRLEKASLSGTGLLEGSDYYSRKGRKHQLGPSFLKNSELCHP